MQQTSVSWPAEDGFKWNHQFDTKQSLQCLLSFKALVWTVTDQIELELKEWWVDISEVAKPSVHF